MKILLAVDDSVYSERGLRMLIAQNPPGKTTVRVLHVVEPSDTPYYPELGPPFPKSLAEIERQRLKAGRELAARAAERLHAAGFKTSVVVRRGHARTTIVDVAAKWRANLIIMGSHGRTAIGRLLLGSVSEYVVRHAPCSVQIVRGNPSKS